MVKDTPAKETDVSDITRWMVGRSVDLSAAQDVVDHSGAKTIMSIRKLWVDMPGEIVRNVDLDIREGEILGIEEYSGSDVKDYNVQLTKLAAQKPDVLLLPNLNVELGLQIQQARTAGLNCPIVCGDSADTPDVANVAGPAIEGVAYVSAFSAESTDAAAKNFVDAYVKLYPDELPNSNAELTYETAKMIVWAIQNAKTLNRDGVRDALDSINGLELPSGKMTMDPTTRNPIKGGVIMQYDADGVTHYVSTVNP